MSKLLRAKNDFLQKIIDYIKNRLILVCKILELKKASLINWPLSKFYFFSVQT